MAAARGEGGGDGLVAVAIALAGVVLLALIFAKPLNGAVWWLLRGEASVVALAEPFLPESTHQRFGRWTQRLALPPPEASAAMTVTGLTLGGQWLRWPLLVLCGGLGIWLIARSPTFRYTRTLDFESLLLEQAKTFVRMRPILWLKGRMTENVRGNYTRARSPYEWAYGVGAITPSASPQETESSWNASKAAVAFAAQLDRPLPPPDGSKLAPMDFHEHLLFVIFAARMMDRKSDSDRLLDGIAVGFGPTWTLRRRLWARMRGRAYDWAANGPWMIRLTAREHALVAEIATAALASVEIHGLLAQHAHMRVLLPAMLERAQSMHGILTTGDFRWIKAVDRTLHFALNDVGRRVACAEAAGIRSHHQAEHEAGHRLPTPDVEAAVEALRVHLHESSWQPPPLAACPSTAAGGGS